IEGRLAMARMLGEQLPESVTTRLDEADALLADARAARVAGTLGYGLVTASKPPAQLASAGGRLASNAP
ncbi:MAG: hypothetical protein ACRDLL_09175, partial [Solirubrobacterales bacterium]